MTEPQLKNKELFEIAVRTTQYYANSGDAINQFIDACEEINMPGPFMTTSGIYPKAHTRDKETARGISQIAMRMLKNPRAVPADPIKNARKILNNVLKAQSQVAASDDFLERYLEKIRNAEKLFYDLAHEVAKIQTVGGHRISQDDIWKGYSKYVRGAGSIDRIKEEIGRLSNQSKVEGVKQTTDQIALIDKIAKEEAPFSLNATANYFSALVDGDLIHDQDIKHIAEQSNMPEQNENSQAIIKEKILQLKVAADAAGKIEAGETELTNSEKKALGDDFDIAISLIKQVHHRLQTKVEKVMKDESAQSDQIKIAYAEASVLCEKLSQFQKEYVEAGKAHYKQRSANGSYAQGVENNRRFDAPHRC